MEADCSVKINTLKNFPLYGIYFTIKVCICLYQEFAKSNNNNYYDQLTLFYLAACIYTQSKKNSSSIRH